MKLSRKQAEHQCAAAWGKEAHLVAYRLWRGGLTYAVRSEDGDRWLPLKRTWVRGQQVFKPEGMPWPSVDNGAWAEAVTKAVALARDHFVKQRNTTALKRLPRARVIAEARNWERKGDESDTWLMASTTSGNAVYQVNSTCSCPDYSQNGVRWCKHRLARALGRRAEQFLREDKGAASVCGTPAPSSMKATTKSDADSTTGSAICQARRIEVVIGYEADEAKSLTLINANGELIEFRADGQVTQPPVQDVAELYRWLQTNDFAPHAFRWLGWERGLRQRLQTYIWSR